MGRKLILIFTPGEEVNILFCLWRQTWPWAGPARRGRLCDKPFLTRPVMGRLFPALLLRPKPLVKFVLRSFGTVWIWLGYSVCEWYSLHPYSASPDWVVWSTIGLTCTCYLAVPCILNAVWCPESMVNVINERASAMWKLVSKQQRKIILRDIVVFSQNLNWFRRLCNQTKSEKHKRIYPVWLQELMVLVNTDI